MIQTRGTALTIAAVLLLGGCGGRETGGAPMKLAGIYAVDRDAVLAAYVASRAGAWPDLPPAERERERSRLEAVARVSFAALEMTLDLAKDGTFGFRRRLRMVGQRARTANGRWTARNDALTLNITHEDGFAAAPRAVEGRLVDGALYLDWDDDLPTLILKRGAGGSVAGPLEHADSAADGE